MAKQLARPVSKTLVAYTSSFVCSGWKPYFVFCLVYVKEGTKFVWLARGLHGLALTGTCSHPWLVLTSSSCQARCLSLPLEVRMHGWKRNGSCLHVQRGPGQWFSRYLSSHALMLPISCHKSACCAPCLTQCHLKLTVKNHENGDNAVLSCCKAWFSSTGAWVLLSKQSRISSSLLANMRCGE